MERTNSTRPNHLGRAEDHEKRVDRLQREADRLYMRERYADAEDKVRELLRVQEHSLGAIHADYADSLGMLGELRFIQDDLTGAEALLRRALEIRGRVVGRWHLDYATSLNSLALVLWQSAHWDEADRLLRQALAIREDLLGLDHPDTARNRSLLKSLRSQRTIPAEEANMDVRDDFSDRDLAGELAALQDWFFDLQERLIAAARDLRASGTPPRSEFLVELAECRSGFSRLCAQARRLAEGLRVPCPEPEELENIPKITALLHEIGQAIAAHSAREETRRRALAVLERVAGLTHRDRPAFEPLQNCRELAAELSRSIAEAPAEALPADADRLASGGDAFNDLLSLVENRRRYSDEEWSRRHLGISKAFGPALAAAVSRGKLDPAAPAPEPDPPAESTDAVPWSSDALSSLLQHAGPFQRMAFKVIDGPSKSFKSRWNSLTAGEW